jgi:hypothetical protein
MAITMPELPEGVEVPEEAVEAAADRFEGLLREEEFETFEFPESFMREALAAAAPALLAAERERARGIIAQFHNDAVRSKIVAEEQGKDSSIPSIRLTELREVLAALDSTNGEG